MDVLREKQKEIIYKLIELLKDKKSHNFSEIVNVLQLSKENIDKLLEWVCCKAKLVNEIPKDPENVYELSSNGEIVGIDQLDFSDLDIFKDEIALLQDPNLLLKVKTELDRLIIGNDKLKVALWIKTFSRFRSRPILDIIVDDPSSGKSYIIKSILKFFEKDTDFKIITTASQKSFYYFDDDWNGKILFLMEFQALDNETVPVFRDWFSEGWDLGLEHRTVDIKRNKLLLKLSKPPYCIIATSDRSIEKQLGDRAWRNNVEKGLEQHKKIKEFEDLKRMKGIDNPDIKIDETFKNIPKCLNTNLKIVIPFAKFINFPFMDKTRINRDIPKFYDFIELIALIHQYQRDVIEIDGKKYLIARFDDFYKAIYYGFEEFLITITEIDRDMNEVLDVLRQHEELTTKEVVKYGKFAYDKTYQILRQLERSGTVGSEKIGREKTWFLVKDVSKNEDVGQSDNLSKDGLKKIFSDIFKESGLPNDDKLIENILLYDKYYFDQIFIKNGEKKPNVLLCFNQESNILLKNDQESKNDSQHLIKNRGENSVTTY